MAKYVTPTVEQLERAAALLREAADLVEAGEVSDVRWGLESWPWWSRFSVSWVVPDEEGL